MTEGTFYNRHQLHTPAIVNHDIIFFLSVYFSYFIAFSAYDLLVIYSMHGHIDWLIDCLLSAR
jgi:hypothetical protein